MHDDDDLPQAPAWRTEERSTFRDTAASLAAEEAARLERIKAEAAPPQACGGADPGGNWGGLHVAPARGRLGTWTPGHFVPQGADSQAWVEAGYMGRKGARVRDIFDDLAAAAARAKRPLGLTRAQVEMAREYDKLAEFVSAGAVKCSSLEGRGPASTGGLDPVDARLAASRQLETWRRRIEGIALSPGRKRKCDPCKAGPVVKGCQDCARIDPRQPIPRRVLVDAVARRGHVPGKVLQSFGWVSDAGKVNGRMRAKIMVALGEALDLMAGPVKGRPSFRRLDLPPDYERFARKKRSHS